MKKFRYILTTAFLLFASTAAMANSPHKEISWDELIPEGAIQPKEYTIEELHELDELLAQEEENADIAGRQFVQAFAGKKIKLPAYVVPLDSDGESYNEFLLVPYFGACIHVPPPPPNQIIYGVDKKGIKNQLFDAVWAYGTLQIETNTSELAEAGYSMKVDKIELLDWEEYDAKYGEQAQ